MNIVTGYIQASIKRDPLYNHLLWMMERSNLRNKARRNKELRIGEEKYERNPFLHTTKREEEWDMLPQKGWFVGSSFEGDSRRLSTPRHSDNTIEWAFKHLGIGQS